MADQIQILPTREMLKRVKGGRDGLYPFFENLTWDVVHYFDDFLGDEIKGSGATPGLYELNTGTDGDFLILANQANGVAELRATASGAGAGDEYAGIALPELAFQGDRNVVAALRLNLDSAADIKVEFGLTDVTTDNGAVNSKSGNSFNAADAAVWIIDTSDSGNWEGMCVNSTSAQTKISPGIAPTASTFETLVVAVREDDSTNNEAAVRFVRLNADGNMTYDSGWNAEYISSDVALVPWFFVQERSGTDKGIRVDFLDVRGRRVA